MYVRVEDGVIGGGEGDDVGGDLGVEITISRGEEIVGGMLFLMMKKSLVEWKKLNGELRRELM